MVHQSFVEDAIQNLVKNRCVVRVSERPHVCSPLSVVSNSMGKFHLVLNLRYLNQYLHVLPFKYEDLCVAALLFEANKYLFKFDLKSGYHHVDIHPSHLFGISVGNKGEACYYVFTVLPFGLHSMLFVHQNDETLNQILAWERAKGHCIP